MHHIIFFAVCLIAVLQACASAQNEEPRAAHASHASPADGPLSGLARVVGDHWLLTLPDGSIQLDTWRWGPGSHSMHGRTMNSKGDAESTSGAVRVLYWHPAWKEVRMLAISQGNLVAEGIVEIGASAAHFDVDLHAPGMAARDLAVRWAFDGPDRYTSTLHEDIGLPKPVFMADWTYVRIKDPLGTNPKIVEPSPGPSAYLAAFESLLGHSWHTFGNEGVALRTTVTRIPRCEAIVMRIESLRGDDEPDHLFDAYVLDVRHTKGMP